jgi:hypothetical protein
MHGKHYRGKSLDFPANEDGRRFTPAVFMYAGQPWRNRTLFGSQRHQRIHIRGSARRTENRCEARNHENRNDGDECRRIPRTDTK